METMTAMEIMFIAFTFVGGFGMFLYGMKVMADGLQKAAGERMKHLLGKLTNNRFVAVITGAIVTAIIQSSSATTVMVVGFVNASLLTLTQAVGVIMGANIGTTITSWIVSSSEWFAVFKPTKVAPLAIGIGAILIMFSKNAKRKQVGEMLIGFGFLFIGIEFMKDSMEPFKEAPAFTQAFRQFGSNPFLGIMVGFGVTAIIQSSSASVSILQTVAALGPVPWNAAVYIILGQNIGTCVTAMLSSIGVSKTAKRAAIIHLMFNVIGTLIFAIGAVLVFTYISPEFGRTTITMTNISIFHTFFNVGNTILLFGFAPQLVKISERIIVGEDESVTSEKATTLMHLDDRILETPAFAVENAMKEVTRMGSLVIDSSILAIEAVIQRDKNLENEIYENEKTINALEKMITEYLVKINNLALSENQQRIVSNLFHTVNDIESIGDYVANIIELGKLQEERDVTFSESAKKELYMMARMASQAVEWAMKAREEEDMELVQSVKDKEAYMDMLEKRLRNKHIERLSKNLCEPASGVIFLDIIGDLERISDHALNIVEQLETEIA